MKQFLSFGKAYRFAIKMALFHGKSTLFYPLDEEGKTQEISFWISKKGEISSSCKNIWTAKEMKKTVVVF